MGSVPPEADGAAAPRAAGSMRHFGGRGMVVYLDELVLDNFCADAALLYCAVRTVKGEVRWLRILLTAALGAALGTAYAVCTLFFRLPAAVDFLVRWGVLFVLPLPAARFKYARTYLLCSLAFVGYMAAFAGILTALFARGQLNASPGTLSYTVFGIPSGVLVAACVAFAWLGVRLVRRTEARAEVISCTCRCTLRLGGQSVTVEGFVDTGNRLRDRRGKPVAVAERGALAALLAQAVLSRRPTETVAVRTVNGRSRLLAVRVDCLEIYCGGRVNRIEDVTVALSSDPLAGEYRLILPALFAKEKDFRVSGGEGC